MIISNEEFTKFYNDQSIKSILKGASSKYSRYLKADDIRSAKMEGLWKALQKHKKMPQLSLDSLIVRQVQWACCRLIKTYTKESKPNIKLSPLIVDNSFNYNKFSEYLDGLDNDIKDILHHRFVDKMTLKEIANKYNCSYQSIFNKITEGVSYIKEQCI